MPHTPETNSTSDPDGSIFLPKTERELEKYKLALLLGRGVGADKTPDEIEAHYVAAERAMEQLRAKVLPEMASVAFAPEI